jgi:hypothetical protein
VVKRARWALLLVLAGSAGAGCEILAGLTGDRTLAPDGGAAPPDGAGPANDAGDAGMCQHATVPEVPDIPDVDGGGPIVLALHSIELSENDTPQQTPIGLDLDLVCTCEGDGPSCQSGSTACDGPEGRDNAAATLFHLLNTGVETFSSTYFSAQAGAGQWSVLFQISHYSKTANDPQLEVDVYPTRGFTGTGQTPLWQGTDLWPISSDAVGDASAPPATDPLYVDARAYVADGVLVFSLPDVPIVLGSAAGELTIRLTAAVFMANLVKTNGQWSMKAGTIAGRWKQSDLFLAASTFKDSMGMPICTTDPAYLLLKGELCNGSDILSEIGSPGSPCDALSVGLGFTADQAELGPVVAPIPPATPCPTGNPANDSCNMPTP